MPRMSREHDDRIDIREIDFRWHPLKALSNLKKHGVSFEEAKTVFGDKQILDVPDTEHSEEELRFIAIGRSEQGRLLFVNFTEAGATIRIISARPAEPWERREYEVAN
jgi:uncharacterized DUF497 family protein